MVKRDVETAQHPTNPNDGQDTPVAVPVRTVLVIAASMTVAALYVALLQVPKTAVDLPFQDSPAAQSVRSLVPQGWAFFTRSPRGETVRVYGRDGGTYRQLTVSPIAEPRNWFGFDRLPRKQGTEYAALLADQPSDGWSDCADDLDLCVDESITARPVRNRAPDPTFCGDIYVVGFDSTPWAWRDFGYDPRTPARSIRLDVSC